MKKILTLLSAFSLTSFSVTSIAACEQKGIGSQISTNESEFPILEYKSNSTLSITKSSLDEGNLNWLDVAKLMWEYSTIDDNNFLIVDDQKYFPSAPVKFLAFYADNVPPVQKIVDKTNLMFETQLGYATGKITSEEAEAQTNVFNVEYSQWLLDSGAFDTESTNFDWSLVNGKNVTFIFSALPEADYQKLMNLSDTYPLKPSKEQQKKQTNNTWTIYKNFIIFESKNIQIRIT